MKKTYEVKGRVFDVFFNLDGQYMVDVSVYEVTNPRRRWFFRNKFFPLWSGYKFIDDFETLNDLLDESLRWALYKEEIAIDRQKKIQEFFANYP